MSDPVEWKGDRQRIGVVGSLHRRILDLCEDVGLVLVDVRGLKHLSKKVLVFDNDGLCCTEVTIEDLPIDRVRGDSFVPAPPVCEHGRMVDFDGSACCDMHGRARRRV